MATILKAVNGEIATVVKGSKELEICELCDNYTSHAWAELDSGEVGYGCLICFENYGSENLNLYTEIYY
jgi:hypothetical protein